MKVKKQLEKIILGLGEAFSRYPLTILFLLVATIMNAVMLSEGTEEYIRFLLTLIIGAILSAIAQQVYERFFVNKAARLYLYAGAFLLALGYYFALQANLELHMEMTIKTAVTIFALLIAFIWVPSIRTKITFN